ncbi:MAG TPA: class I SAM-dependent RNA methyltransferase [Geopsychrobacteraceae bacterium]|nr:class I SAM-dependent RNA methyltransferase [Geopsychrobacteraceae bacterium]
MKQRQDRYFVVTLPGLEEVCCKELKRLGIEPLRLLVGGVEFEGGLRELYLANLWLRAATRILVRVGELHARDFPGFYRKLLRLPWGRFLHPGGQLDVRASCHSSRLVHSGRVAETVSAAIERTLGASSSTEGEASLVMVRLEDDNCVVSVDSSGTLLHRRGYRQDAVAAPLRETLAAGILQLLGWDGSKSLVDAMTGSGTFAIEAALIAANRPPGRHRRFAFMEWPRYRNGLWQSLLQEADRQRLETTPIRICGVDINSQAIAAANKNAAQAGVSDLIDFSVQPMQELQVPAVDGLILCNPPYGERIGDNETLDHLYVELGHLYKNVFSEWQAALLSPRDSLTRATGLNWQQRLLFSNGGLKVSLLQRK